MTAPMSGATDTRPISGHPAFRWLVALWFAALLAGGTFVMPDPVVASLRGALGIDRFVGNALLARLVLSALAGLFGLLLGLVIAMRVTAFGDAQERDEPEAWSEDDLRDEDVLEATGPWLEEVDEAPVEATGEEAPRRPFNPREYLTDEGYEAATQDPIEVVDADFEEVVEETGGDGPIVPAAPEADRSNTAEMPETELEWTEVGKATAGTRPEPLPAPLSKAAVDAIGDLSLADLTARLAQAIAAQRAAEERGTTPADGDVDPVIAFLRREADRSAPPASAEAGTDDPQASLRSALERLSQDGKRP
ncbi:hypothetical protein K3172_02845 [Qipengyuania sp. 6B39]|uniref:hypothetical protein n=1 Tax=Qipengyuania proteolytica TaxID=2867239 RepID=UPI001C8979BF|nr:hypothetical protein [Qipengyuania proteolytica]MBX7494791.1 hypothetical protein [Qipengyuania proteolytica]